MNTSLWVDLRRDSKYELAKDLKLSVFGRIWSLSLRRKGFRPLLSRPLDGRMAMGDNARLGSLRLRATHAQAHAR